MISPPAAPGDFPDPFVAEVPGGWAAFATNAGGRNVQVRFSPDLDRWEERPDALPALPGWAAPGWTWSPAVAAAGSGWVLWYTLRHRDSGRQAISVASSASWDGPYVDFSPGPAVFQADQGGSIDPSVFRDGAGALYLVWKADANAVGRPSSLWGAPLSADGRALAGGAVRLLDNDRGWESPLIEAPSLFAASGRYSLAYSARWWESAGYSMGLAVGDSPLGPFTKLTRRRPWISGDAAGAGPGGGEVFSGPGGALWVAYHAWDPARVGYGAGGQRSLRLGRLGTFPGANSAPGGEESWWRRALGRIEDPPLPDLAPPNSA